ncbi:MAG TPA: chemotaxis protein CheB [Acidimicrobiales bacterium]|nr:chemotaxis protein CheB [Acidimicrobiales bacterium]
MGYRLAVVGGSWGGLDALGRLLALLDPGGPLAVAAALHRAPNGPEGALVSYLRSRSRLPVAEAEDKDEIEPGHVYLAPADYHLLVEPGRFALSIDAPIHFSRPSIDVLFESAADAYAEAATAVVLTGANADGCSGLCQVKRRGGLTLVQDPETAVRREMPDAAIATGVVDEVLTVEEIALRINELASR